MFKNILIILISATNFIGCNVGDLGEKSISQSVQINLPEVIISNNESCPDEMSWVHGHFCTKVQQDCEEFLDRKTGKFTPRCKKFKPSVCIGEKVYMNFCIDTKEYSEGSSNLPKSNISWSEAKNLCEEQGKKLCSEPEWTFACEGQEMFPYPTGLTRPSEMCNIDISKNIVCGRELCDNRNSIYANERCLSPFGVHNMVGNTDEWIIVNTYYHSKIENMPLRSSLKGGHWLPVRSRCRPRTDDHAENGFFQISIGFRCCQDI